MTSLCRLGGILPICPSCSINMRQEYDLADCPLANCAINRYMVDTDAGQNE